MKKIDDFTLIQDDSGTIDENRLEQYLDLIGEKEELDELLRSFNTYCYSGMCFDESEEEGEIYRSYYVIGIIGDGDMGASVYVCRPSGSMKIHQFASYLFEETRAEDLQAMGELFHQMSNWATLAEGLEELEFNEDD